MTQVTGDPNHFFTDPYTSLAENKGYAVGKDGSLHKAGKLSTFFASRATINNRNQRVITNVVDQLKQRFGEAVGTAASRSLLLPADIARGKKAITGSVLAELARRAEDTIINQVREPASQMTRLLRDALGPANPTARDVFAAMKESFARTGPTILVTPQFRERIVLQAVNSLGDAEFAKFKDIMFSQQTDDMSSLLRLARDEAAPQENQSPGAAWRKEILGRQCGPLLENINSSRNAVRLVCDKNHLAPPPSPEPGRQPATWHNATPQTLATLEQIGGPSFKTFIQALLYDEVMMSNPQSILRTNTPGALLLRAKFADMLREPLNSLQHTQIPMLASMLPRVREMLQLDPHDEAPLYSQISGKFKLGEEISINTLNWLLNAVGRNIDASPALKSALAECTAILRDCFLPLLNDKTPREKEIIMSSIVSGTAIVGVTGEIDSSARSIGDVATQVATRLSSLVIMKGFKVDATSGNVVVPFSPLVPNWNAMIGRA